MLLILLPVSAVSPTSGVPSSPPHPESPLHITADLPPSINVDMLDTEALIKVEIFLVSANSPSNGGSGKALQTASVQFNNLDIIGTAEHAPCLLMLVFMNKATECLYYPQTLFSSCCHCGAHLSNNL
jgi:hypothetical protein